MNESPKKSASWLCDHVWRSAYLRADGLVSPCCRYNGGWNPSPELTPAATPQFSDLRRRMLAGDLPNGCKKCIEEERIGLKSKRLHSLSEHLEFPEIAKEGQTTYVGIELGNICNLGCLTCNPSSSSLWNRYADAAGYAKYSQKTISLDRLRYLAPHLETLELWGGETFLSPQIDEVLEIAINGGNPERIFLKIVTNATIFPTAKTRGLLSHFGQVKIMCSVDAIGERNEYIRFPSKWPEFQANVGRFLDLSLSNYNFNLGIQATISAYSLGGLRELVDWWLEFNGHRGLAEEESSLYIGYVTKPEIQSVYVLSRSVRERLTAEFSRADHAFASHLRRVTAYALAQDRCQLLPELREWTAKMDLARGLSARDYVPELFED